MILGLSTVIQTYSQQYLFSVSVKLLKRGPPASLYHHTALTLFDKNILKYIKIYKFE